MDIPTLAAFSLSCQKHFRVETYPEPVVMPSFASNAALVLWQRQLARGRRFPADPLERGPNQLRK